MNQGIRYSEIVFMQDDEGREVVDRLANVDGVVAYGPTEESIEATVEYLAQWDYADDYDVRDTLSAGAHDIVIEHNGYVLSFNVGLGYVGLARIIAD